MSDRSISARRFLLGARARRHLHAVPDADRWIQDDAVAGLEAGADLDRGAVVALQIEMAPLGDPVLEDGGAEAILVEDHRLAGNDDGRRLARHRESDAAIEAGVQEALAIVDIDLGLERAGRGIERAGVARDLPLEDPAGHLRHDDIRLLAVPKAED